MPHPTAFGLRALLVLAGVALLVTSAVTLSATPIPPVAPVGSCGSLQARIDAAPAGSVLNLTGCSFDSGATISKPVHLTGGALHVPYGHTGMTVASEDVTLDGMKIIGPQGTVFDGGEIGIAAIGTSTSPIRNLIIRNCEISGFGGVGASLLNVTNVLIEHNRIYDIVYAGIMVLSGNGGAIRSNDVERIGVVGSEANSGNAYGIALTRQGGSLEVSPPTQDFTVSSNLIEDVPTWHALDTHAGRRIAFINNTIREASRPIFITTDGADHRSTDITVSDNIIEAPTANGFNVQAITTFASDNVVVTGNRAAGWNASQFFEDFGNSSTGLTVQNNVILP